jgi:putative CocE/NonD family hydrolase
MAPGGECIPAVLETTRYGTEYKYSFILKSLINLGIAHDPPPAIVEELMKSKYAYVAVDARGSGASFGTRKIEWSKEEADDIGQVIAWIARQGWSNGKVGTYGMSYSGNTAEVAAASNQPALQAAAPLYPDFDIMRQIVMPGGIYNEVLAKMWGDDVMKMDTNPSNLFTAGNVPVDEDKDGKLMAKAVADHHTLDIDQAMKKVTYLDDIVMGNYTARSLSPYNYRQAIQKSGVPLYVRVGWQDAGTVNGSIARFLTYSNSQTLVIGPWSHGGWHYNDPFIKTSYGKKELDCMQAKELITFYDRYLKGNDKSKQNTGKVIQYYTMGEGKWKTSATWPVAGFANGIWYFDANNSLKTEKPSAVAGTDSYKVDFTASTGKTNRWFTNCGGGPVFYPDRAEEDRKLLTYTSNAFENDVEITGTPVVTLNVSSTAADGAFYVYLEDVAPDGKVTYITEGELRALHRKTADIEDIGYNAIGTEHSYLKKDGEKLVPGKNAEIKIGMYATSVLIKKGHRIRIAVAGHDAASFQRIPVQENPVIKVQRNSILSSYAEIPMMVRK